MKLEYPGSDPLAVTTNEDGEYVLPPGSLRIWTKQGDQPRNGTNIVDGGDYVAPGEYWANEFGLSEGNRTLTYYVEAVKISDEIADKRILFAVDPDGYKRTPPHYIAADAVRMTFHEYSVQWVVEGSFVEADVGGALTPEETAPFDGIPGQPGGAGGFGGPPEGSGFGRLQDSFTIKNFSISNDSTEVASVMNLRLVSNVAAWTNDHVLAETATNSNVYTNESDSLAVHVVEHPANDTGVVDTARLFVSSMEFGWRGYMELWETGLDTGSFESEHLELVGSMTQFPDTGRVDSVEIALTSTLSSGLVSTGILTETAADSLIFTNEAGTLGLRILRMTGYGETNRDDFTAVVSSEDLGVCDRAVDAIETETNSLVFRTDALGNQGPPGTGPGAEDGLLVGKRWRPTLRIPKSDKIGWPYKGYDQVEVEICRIRGANKSYYDKNRAFLPLWVKNICYERQGTNYWPLVDGEGNGRGFILKLDETV